jgi:dihydroxyacetone kinase-like predicted kinase
MADIKATTAAPKTAIGSALAKAVDRKKAKEAVAATVSGSRDARQPMTLERAKALAPHLGLMENIARSFALDAMSQASAEEVYNELRDTMRAQINAQADILSVVLSKPAMKVHLQRVVGAYVASAIGAGEYYQKRVTLMRDMHSAVANEHRDEDRDAPAGFESRLDRARRFAAELAAQSFGLLALADGAVAAHEDATGDQWKPYESQTQAQPVSKQAAAAQLAAFES